MDVIVAINCIYFYNAIMKASYNITSELNNISNFQKSFRAT